MGWLRMTIAYAAAVDGEGEAVLKNRVGSHSMLIFFVSFKLASVKGLKVVQHPARVGYRVNREHICWLFTERDVVMRCDEEVLEKLIRDDEVDLNLPHSQSKRVET